MSDTERNILRQINYLELEKEFWTVEELAERVHCTVEEARKFVESLNI